MILVLLLSYSEYMLDAVHQITGHKQKQTTDILTYTHTHTEQVLTVESSSRDYLGSSIRRV